MKRLVTLLFALLALAAFAGAQVAEPQTDSTLVGSSLFHYMPSNVSLKQSSAVRDSYQSIVQKNRESMSFTGFRIKVYQSSAQNAREESDNVLAGFNEEFPYIAADRSYDSPYFKVTAGYFRTRVEAEKALRLIRSSFPTASIVKEKMKYPSL